ncbi:MAG: phosphoethanolamine--lipid A transferase [Neorhizobium sp.]|nr:phosphoethanolamine--lipid A transferase [Neorhizobium sp.]
MAYSVQKAARTRSVRPEIGSVTFSAVIAAYLLFAANHTLWEKLGKYLGASSFTVGAFYLGTYATLFALITIFSVKYLMKPFAILMIWIAAAAAWFMDQFSVVIDKDMIRNAAETTGGEAGNLLTPDYALHLLLFAGLPTLVILIVRIRHRTFFRKLAWNTLTAFACLAVVIAVFATNTKAIMLAHREHRDLFSAVNPIGPVVSAIEYAVQANEEAHMVIAPLGTDAKLMPAIGGMAKPRVTIVVAGETARSYNFSLNGYKRDTNPELAKRGVIYFPDTESCGTSTAVSIPCMFSPFTRAGYSHSRAAGSESLMDVLTHAGIKTEWWDNNTGSKGVATRIKTLELENSTDPRFCSEGECQDQVLMEGLDAWLDGVTKDSVLVLHQIGSHGPTYHKRYPDQFKRFTPDCQAAEPTNCSDAELMNAYDNTIVYTDHILATVIDALKARGDRLAGAMIYASDHGESLGENGVYLHGAPYFMAPKEQTHVPFLVWADHDFARSMGLDMSCLQKTTAQPHSHDNWFPSILSMMNVKTSVYDPKLDLFGQCRANPLS